MHPPGEMSVSRFTSTTTTRTSFSGFSAVFSRVFLRFLPWLSLIRGRRAYMGAHKIAHAAYQGPSVVKEIIYGISLGLLVGGLWKMQHWNNQRRTKEFYDLLEKGEISVVVEDE